MEETAGDFPRVVDGRRGGVDSCGGSGSGGGLCLKSCLLVKWGARVMRGLGDGDGNHVVRAGNA